MHAMTSWRDCIDGGQDIDWGASSADYGAFRPGPPASFYNRLRAFDIGREGQRILDLGTGTGVLAREFARAGCICAGVDLSAGQLAQARQLAEAEALEIDFRQAPAEETPFEDGTFDLVTANQCWLYFDMARVIPEVRRLLAPEGQLVVSHFTFMPRLDEIARATEELVLKYNPQWNGADWHGRIPARPGWSRDDFDLRLMFYYDEGIEFGHETWRGRLRALRGIGPTLSEQRVAEFDRDLQRLLSEIAPARFQVLHRIDAHVFQFKEPKSAAPDPALDSNSVR